MQIQRLDDVNVNAPAEQAPAMAPPTRTNDQILPRSSWVTVGKSNYYLDVEKSQSNLIYKIDFWDTVRYVKNSESYSCQLDKQWFDLNKDTLRDALQITPVDNNNLFSSPPTPDVLINFVNHLGYPKVIRLLSAVMTNDMYQPWRALTTILWGVVNRAHIDYAKRMWEEFTQSIHSFIKDKKNMALNTQGKKKANPLVIPSVSAKGTKREVFGMPILNDLITANIRGGQYYNEYLEKVAKHQRYLAGEEGSDTDSPTPKPAKATKPKETKKYKPLAPKAAPVTKPAAAKASKSTSSQQPKHKPTPAMPQEHKSTSPLRLVDEFVDEGVLKNEPRFDDEKANLQRAVAKSLKDVHPTHRGPLPPVVFREPDSGRRQPLPEGGLDPSDSAESRPLPSQRVHTGSSLDPMDEGLSFDDQFFNDKPSKAENEKTTAETESESIVFITIQQDTSAIPPMTIPVIDLTSKPDSPKKLENLNIPQQVSKAVDEIVTDAVDWAIQASLRDRFRDLPEADMKEILHQRMWETNSCLANEDHKNLYEAPKKSMVNLTQNWWKPLSEEDRPATPEPAWSIPSFDLTVPMNNWASALASTYAPPPENSLLAQTDDMAIFIDCKPLPLGGQPGQVTIQTDFFFNKYLEYLRYGSKGGRPALSISKMKAAYYPDVGLEQMVPDEMWIEEECKHTSESDHKAVQTHKRILSVVRIKVLPLYGYDYMKKIILRRSDLKENIISERDFKYLYPSNFEDLYLLNLQGHLNHPPPKDKKTLTTAVNLWTRNFVIRQWVEDFQLGIESYQS
uniref:Monodehydroascorbate reductase n=1 Tax=Tanacetum cinerariifolium TaxID=118510 RepID=A0A6L2NF58_TANCI|nr:hypothetical protein [Tanacetum cinerariifolium]